MLCMDATFEFETRALLLGRGLQPKKGGHSERLLVVGRRSCRAADRRKRGRWTLAIAEIGGVEDLNRTYSRHKNLPGIYLSIFTKMFGPIYYEYSPP